MIDPRLLDEAVRRVLDPLDRRLFTNLLAIPGHIPHICDGCRDMAAKIRVEYIRLEAQQCRLVPRWPGEDSRARTREAENNLNDFAR